MNPILAEFLRAHCRKDSAAVVGLKAFAEAFRAGLPEAVRPQWTRSRLVAELAAAGFTVGTDSANVLHVAGLTLANQQAAWRTDSNGRLVRSPVPA